MVDTKMRKVRLVGVGAAVMLAACGSAAEARTVDTFSLKPISPVSEALKSSLRPLKVELAGESVSKTSPENVWYYWRITNPNDVAVGFMAELPELGNTGEYLGSRIEVPSDPYSRLDIWRQVTMVPAQGNIVVFFPPIHGGIQQKPIVQIREVNQLKTFWGLSATNDVSLIGHEFDGRFLKLRIGASQQLQGNAVVQVQVVLLNKDRQVVDLVYTNTSEVDPLGPEESATLTLDMNHEAPFETYEVNILGLSHP